MRLEVANVVLTNINFHKLIFAKNHSIVFVIGHYVYFNANIQFLIRKKFDAWNFLMTWNLHSTMAECFNALFSVEVNFDSISQYLEVFSIIKIIQIIIQNKI